ncbi:MAG TPA: ATP-binding protein [Solirubrobacteraceae bacterium]|jgi:two-component system OmpR family sensor kinase|nr:ATP-binding protein [Solirubrobacteraceae bacterium]
MPAERRGRLRLPTGLRWRLAAWIAFVVLVSSAVTFVVVYRGTGSQLRNQIDQEIRGDAGEFAQALRTSGARSPASTAAAADRYIRAQPFSASSTLLFATIPGAGTSTNRPELFGSPAPDNGETAAEQAQENQLSRHLLSASTGYSTLQVPDIGDLRLLVQEVPVPGGRSVRGRRIRVGVGEPLASVAHAQRGVARAFILAGLLTLVGALLGSLLIGTRFSRPLRRMAAVAAQVDAGDLYPRIHDVAREGEEVRVLADAFNHMLDRLTDAFAGQRAFVADASHELRTPLTVIRGQLEVLAAQAHPQEQEVRRVERLVQAEVARITRLVDDLLLLAKSEQTQFLRLEPIALQRFVAELWDGISLLGADRRFELGEIPSGTLDADPDRLAQALRNLIGNAIEHTAPGAGLVRLDLERGAGGRVRFVVQDNGPGIPADQRERVFDRFHRTDAARDRASGGTGLGLAIVRAIAEAHGGYVRASVGFAGGARIDLELPRFAPAASADIEGQPASASGPATGPVAGFAADSKVGSAPDLAGASAAGPAAGADARAAADARTAS